ncbi:hypothetical protein BX616_010675 [Lobosporangium transversale]|uniref:DUF202 domain-containing protein n=1 Tax=Lobosporangium transversale TaxID=64571 RepID=A0A1Y2GS82_9FUNG|nr:hypothetical protein BCR41DRAFT_421017 [Lobosporangium transversale]KAF9911084.1 hypothetical protein BX616_010675 [Lobosporangium transversale]ORZ20991.1 hypothetical protein BCR41DRAFT_421017 [Lobosporangium transversale]|eukprot:XP_021882900.1 hypothetical protein BCR41DRAFT_421017 [Lobosporangium transversale]
MEENEECRIPLSPLIAHAGGDDAIARQQIEQQNEQQQQQQRDSYNQSISFDDSGDTTLDNSNLNSKGSRPQVHYCHSTTQGILRRISLPQSRVRARSYSSPEQPSARTVGISRARSNSCYIVNNTQLKQTCDELGILYYGPTAIEEEEAALNYAAELAAARAARVGSGIIDRRRSLRFSRAAASTSAASPGSNVSRSRSRSISIFNLGFGSSSHDLEAAYNSEDEDQDEDEEESVDEEEQQRRIEEELKNEKDHCLSGILLPRSQFFRTSVICSNTMARDGFANERTFLSWLNATCALCLISLSFITRAFSLDSFTEQLQGRAEVQHKNRVSRVIGYACFTVAFFAAIYSMLKYLRNIRRISTRYPFVQAGVWTFTVGMFMGTLVMVALVLAYTTNI